MKFNWLFVFCIIFVSCVDRDGRRPVNKKKTITNNYASILLNKTIKAMEENEINNYILKDSLLTYNYSPYGFAYAKLKTSLKQKKQMNQPHKVNYIQTVYNMRNDLIYNNVEKTIVLDKLQETKGVEEGLKLMKEDEEFKFIFSSFVFHGFTGDGNKIGANTPVVVKIKLLKIK